MNFIAESVFPPEIVNKILLNLELKDLLNTRLVSGSWNLESLHVLRNSKYRICFKIFNNVNNSLENYLKFVQGQSAPEFILPFTISLCFITSPEISQVLGGIKTLINLFGPTCVRGLDLWSSIERKEFYFGIIPILSHVCQGLEFLRIYSTGPASVSLEGEVEDLYGKIKHVNIPKLEKLSIILTSTSPTTYDQVFMRLLTSITSNLEQLEIEIPHDQLDEWYWPFPLHEKFPQWSKIESMKMTQIPATMLRSIAPEILFKGPPLQLKKLDLIIEWRSMPFWTPITGILEYFAPTLETLELKFLPCNYLMNGQHYLNPCVPLSKLKELVIQMTQRPHLCIDPSLFPGLESIQISHDLEFSARNHEYRPAVFPSVKILNLRVKPSSSNINTMGYKNHMNRLTKFFPNLNTVSLINDDDTQAVSDADDDEMSATIKYVIRGIAESESASNIIQMELVDFYQNYIAKALRSNSKPTRLILENLNKWQVPSSWKNSILFTALTQLVGEINLNIYSELLQVSNDGDGGKMSNCLVVEEERRNPADIKMTKLRQIRLNISDKVRENLAQFATCENELYLVEMIECFPSVEKIKVSPFLFNSIGKVNANIISDFYAKHPNVKIAII